MASIVVTPPLVIAAGAVFPPVCAVVVALRFASRRYSKVGYGPDDWLTVPALILLIGISAAVLRGIAEHAVAYRTPDLTVEEQIDGTSAAQTAVRKVFFSVQAMQCVALGCIKISCMLFYRRIFAGSTKLNRTIWGIIAFIAAWTVAFFFSLLSICGSHFDYAWTSIANELKCDNITATQDSYAVTDVLTDLIVLSFPIPLVWKLHMSTGSKVALSLIFLLGTLAIIASITRMVIYIQVLLVEDSPNPPDEDLLSSAGSYFMLLETGIGLIAVCLPSLYSLVARRGLHSIVRSVASAISLSERSNGRRSQDSPRGASAAIHDGMPAKSGQTTIARASIENSSSRDLPQDGIQLTQTFGTTVKHDTQEV